MGLRNGKEKPVFEECPCVDVAISRICPVRGGPKGAKTAQLRVILAAFCVELRAFWLELELATSC